MMARAIQENYALYDGFIICHGTDTLAYSAAALSYLIQNADKPIILTGAQQPISNEITDAKKNLRDSVVCAIPEGHRLFGGSVHEGEPRQGQPEALQRVAENVALVAARPGKPRVAGVFPPNFKQSYARRRPHLVAFFACGTHLEQTPRRLGASPARRLGRSGQVG